VLDERAHSRQPRTAIVVVERNPAPHLVAIRLRVQIVGVAEVTAEGTREHPTDGGFARASDPHQDNHH
jgi:hypothetical protein